MELQHVKAPGLGLIGDSLLFGQGTGTHETFRALVNLPFDYGHGVDVSARSEECLLDGDGDALAVPFRAPAGPDLQRLAETVRLRQELAFIENGGRDAGGFPATSGISSLRWVGR